MAEITKYSKSYDGALTAATLDGADTAALTLQGSATLYIDNATGAEVTLNVLGDTATSTSINGYGALDLTTGLNFTVADASEQSIPLNGKYKFWLGDGNLTITGGTGCTAYIVEG